MKLTTRQKIDAAYAVALLSLLLVGYVSYVSIRTYRQDQSRITSAHNILRQLEGVLADLKDAETGQRGYLLARRDEFLAPYLRAQSSVGAQMDSLRWLVAGEPDRMLGLDSLQVLVDRRMEALAYTLGMAQTGHFDAAIEVVRGGTGRQLMDAIRGKVSDLERAELASLGERRAAAERSGREAERIIIFGSIFVFLVVGLARTRILRDLRARERAEQNLARSERSLRELYQIASSQNLSFHEKLRELLAMGCDRFDLEIGVMSHIEGERYEVVEAYDPRERVRRGDVFSLAEVYCSVAVDADEPVALEHVGCTDLVKTSCYADLRLESYIGVPVAVGGAPYGVLCFSDPAPREVAFTEVDKDFLRLLGQWIGREVERQRWEEALRQREERFRGLVENASDLIYVLDRHGRFTYVNPVAVRATGYSEEELLGLHAWELLPDEYREEVSTGFSEQIRTRTRTRYYELPLRTREEREIWLGHSVQILMENDRHIGLQGVARDITAAREMERMKDEFLSVVSHELRTPLTAIRGSLGLLASGRLGTLETQGQRMLEIAAQNSDRLVRLINDLLDIDKMESGQTAIDQKAADAADLIRQSVEMMAPMAAKSQVKLVTSPPHVRIWVDPDRVLQVLTNLLSNAIKFSPTGGTVTIGAERRGEEFLIAVQDEGRGIPSDKLELIFERFHQVDSSDARQRGGTGLGLSIARSIVHQHGGRIWAQSRWGRGSTFFFTLPCLGSGEEGSPERGEQNGAEPIHRIETEREKDEANAAANSDRG